MVAALVGLGALGATLHVAGSVLIVFGQAAVKVAHSILDSTGAPSTWAVPHTGGHPPLWRRPDGKWRRQKAGSKAYAVGGWGAFAVGNVMRFIAMRFAAQTVLSGLGSLQFVIIPVASRFMLGIRANTSTFVGVSIVLLGNALIILYGPAEVTFTLEQLRHQWATPAMTAFLMVVGSLLCVLKWAYWRITGSGLQLQPQLAVHGSGIPSSSDGATLLQETEQLLGRPAATGGNASGSWSAGRVCGGTTNGPLVAREQDAATVFAAALLFSVVASFVGAWSVLFSKSMTYVVSYLPASLWDWYSWFILLAFLGTAGFWVRQSDQGLRYFPASLIMPLMQAFWMCMSVLEGGIYFDELIGLPSRDLAFLMLGLLLALLGAVFMGIAGFIAETPEHMLHYRAAGSELTHVDTLSPPPTGPAKVAVLVESATGRADRLSSPVLRTAGGTKNGFYCGSSASTEVGKSWWQQDKDIPIQAHAVSGIDVGQRGVDATLVCSPTQQLLRRGNSSIFDNLDYENNSLELPPIRLPS